MKKKERRSSCKNCRHFFLEKRYNSSKKAQFLLILLRPFITVSSPLTLNLLTYRNSCLSGCNCFLSSLYNFLHPFQDLITSRPFYYCSRGGKSGIVPVGENKCLILLPQETHTLRPMICCCFFESLAVNYFTFTALQSADKFLNEQQSFELNTHIQFIHISLYTINSPTEQLHLHSVD